MIYALPALAGVIAIISVILSPKADSEEAFFKGLSRDGRQPGLLTLTFSQVTTWIFARSLLNAAILGFYYGIWGTLAYATYYLSFLTGGRIVDSLRFQHGFQVAVDQKHGREPCGRRQHHGHANHPAQSEYRRRLGDVAFHIPLQFAEDDPHEQPHQHVLGELRHLFAAGAGLDDPDA